MNAVQLPGTELGLEPSYEIEEELEQRSRVRRLKEVLLTLTPREERVLRSHFGLGCAEAKTYRQIGEEFGVTQERIRQIEAKAIRKLKHPSRRRKFIDYRPAPKRNALAWFKQRPREYLELSYDALPGDMASRKAAVEIGEGREPFFAEIDGERVLVRATGVRRGWFARQLGTDAVIVFRHKGVEYAERWEDVMLSQSKPSKGSFVTRMVPA